MEQIELDGGKIRYRLRGSGPPLVLLSTLSGSWTRQISALTEYFSVLTYDMRGFGDSPSNNGFPSNEAHADDLAQVLSKLGIGQSAVVGMSHGGLVAQHFAAKYPERLAGLSLVSTFARPHGPALMLLRMLNGFLDRGDLTGFWEVLKSLLFSEAGSAAMLRRETALRGAMFDQYDVAALSSIYRQALEHDSTGWFAAVDCPVLVVGGDEDILFPPVLTEQLAGLVPGSRMELLPAAHIPPVEAPQPFNELLLSAFGDQR